MAGCAHRDNAALVAQVEAFERRLGSLLGAGDGDLDEVAGFESVLPQEGGPTW
jgi:hypothetical protein